MSACLRKLVNTFKLASLLSTQKHHYNTDGDSVFKTYFTSTLMFVTPALTHTHNSDRGSHSTSTSSLALNLQPSNIEIE